MSIHDYLSDTEDETPRCLEADETCSGAIEYRMPLSGTGKPFPRCEHHWELRLRLQEETNRKYAPDSDCPPEGCIPTYGGWETEAGERWEED